MNSNLGELLRALEISANRTQLNRVGDRLRKQLAHLFEAGLQNQGQSTDSLLDDKIPHRDHEPSRDALPGVPADRQVSHDKFVDSQTDRINRLLVLWLDLQNAVRNTPPPQRVPWECDDEKVAFLWDQITHAENQRGLEEWLFQVPSGESETWAQRALLECRRRCREAAGPAD